MTIANDLWQKNGGAPTQILFRDFDADGQSWTDLANSPLGQAACGWTKAPGYPDYDPSTQQPIWTNDAWDIVDLPPPVPAPTDYQVSHKEFLDLLTFAEQVQLCYFEKLVEQQTPQQFIDAGNTLGQMFAVANKQFNASTMIVLNNPATIWFVLSLLVPANVLTQSRAADVLARRPPPTS